MANLEIFGGSVNTIPINGTAAITGGNLLIGTTTENASGGCLQLKSGITFPATQVASSDPNTLDDYEEGTWTPVIAGGSTAGSGTYISQQGKYVKIGRVVTVHCNINWSAHTGTGSLYIYGLPFTSESGTGYYCNGSSSSNMLTYSGTSISIQAVAGQSYCRVITDASNTATTVVTMDSAASLNFSLVYFV